MSALTRLLLIPAALTLWSATAAAKDISGLPMELAGGTFARSQALCRAHFKNVEDGTYTLNWNVVIFGEKDGKYTYGDCNVSCSATISGYRVIKNGYVLKMNWLVTKNANEDFYVTRLGANKLRLRAQGSKVHLDIVRCAGN